MNELPIEKLREYLRYDSESGEIYSKIRPGEVTRWENQKNIKMQARNTSGTVGVQWSKQANRWTAIISVDKKPKSLGFFKEKADAIAARKFAEIKYGYHPNHGRAA